MSNIYDAMKQHVYICNGNYKEHQECLPGKRCLRAVVLYYDDRGRIFHTENKPGRLPCMMIENTKKSFFFRIGEEILEYFYNWNEDRYMQAYHHGTLNQYQYTCEASLKSKQCYYGLELNTDMINMIYEYLTTTRK
jgi:hypothetical protein